MNDLNPFFEHLDDFEHKHLFDKIPTLWHPLTVLGDALQFILHNLSAHAHRMDAPAGLRFIPTDRITRYPDPGIVADDWIEFKEQTYLPQAQVVFEEGTILEPTAIVKGPAVIGKHCEIRQGAYLRGNVVTGDHCILGHNTEIKNSILMNHTEAGHFNYIGDSILGSYVNLGAGTRLANLQFRTSEEKTEGFIHPITLDIDGKEVETGMEKFGAIIGDYVELGCNSVTCPGVLMGKNSWAYPNATIAKGFYPANSRFSNKPGRGPAQK